MTTTTFTGPPPRWHPPASVYAAHDQHPGVSPEDRGPRPEIASTAVRAALDVLDVVGFRKNSLRPDVVVAVSCTAHTPEVTMHTLETFVKRTHSRGETMPSESIGIAAARELVSRVDGDALAELASVSRQYLPAVLEEIDALQSAIAHNPAELARRAVLFGIATPNRDETQSLAWAMSAAAHYRTRSPEALANVTYASLKTSKESRIGLRTSLTTTLEDVYARFDDVRPADLVPEALERVRGIGPKVARMITAVANPDAHVWTVDLWHIRQLLWAAGLEYRVRASVDANAYQILEERWLRYRADYFSDVPVWSAQWATWNAADGRHNPHNVLWWDLAR